MIRAEVIEDQFSAFDSLMVNRVAIRDLVISQLEIIAEGIRNYESYLLVHARGKIDFKPEKDPKVALETIDRALVLLTPGIQIDPAKVHGLNLKLTRVLRDPEKEPITLNKRWDKYK